MYIGLHVKQVSQLQTYTALYSPQFYLQVFTKVRNNVGDNEFCRKIREELTDDELNILKSLFSRFVRCFLFLLHKSRLTAISFSGMPDICTWIGHEHILQILQVQQNSPYYGRFDF